MSIGRSIADGRERFDMAHSPSDAFANAAWAPPQDGVVLAIRRHILACVAIVAIAIVVALVVVILSTKEYTAEAIVSLENSRLQSMPNQLAITPMTVDLFAVKAAAETVSSPAIAERALDALNLWRDPELTQSSLLHHIAAEVVGIARSMFDVPALEAWLGVDPSIRPSDYRDRIRERFQHRILISQTPQSLLLTVGYVSNDPRKAARVANALANIYLELGQKEKIGQINLALTHLEVIADHFHERMIAAQDKLKAYRDKLGIIELGNNANQLTASTQNTFELNNRYLAARSDRIEQEARLQELRARAKSYTAGVSIGGITSPLIQQLELQRVALQVRRAEVVAVDGAGYPLVERLSAQIRDIDRSIASALDSFIRSNEDSLRVAQSKEDTLAGELRASKADNQQQSSAGAELVDLEAQAAAAKNMFESSISNLSRAAQAVSLQQPDARVISLATAPLSPSFRRTLLIVAFGAIMGTACAALFVYLREASSRKFWGIASLEDLSRIPVLALLPSVKKSRRSLSRPTFQAAVDAMRLHLTSGAAGAAEPRGCALLVASSMAQEGKSAVSFALAEASAQAGERVLLIEGDTRKPSEAPDVQGCGLAAIMDGRADLGSTNLTERRPGLFVLPSGEAWNRAIGPAEYRKLRLLIGDATRAFDLVVIDSPPVLSTPDGAIYAKLVDRVLFLIRWRTTPLAAAARGLLEVSRERPGASAICVTQLSLHDIRQLSRNWSHGYGGYWRAYWQIDAA
jgi:succinoglycan biosynthesis transport protein ExoP